MNIATNIWAELNEIESLAIRHKRNTSLKKYLITDLEMIKKRIDGFRKELAFKGKSEVKKISKECLFCEKGIPEDMKWCSMSCKKDFLLDNYDSGCTIRMFQEYEDTRIKRRMEFKEKLHESGVSPVDYILGNKKDAFEEKSE